MSGFTDRLDALFNALGLRSGSEFARFAGYDRSYVSRLRAGQRTPAPDSAAADRLARSIAACARERGALDALGSVVGCPSPQSEQALREAVAAWLFGDEPSPRARRRPGRRRAEPSGAFGHRLSSVMELAELSNARLARLAHVDASVISRYRRGLRSPGGSPNVVSELCRVLLARVRLRGELDALGAMLAEPADALADDDVGAALLAGWLSASAPDEAELVERLLGRLDSLPSGPERPLPPLPELLGPETDTPALYYGRDGLRTAVIRFLSDVLRGGARRLRLYSDESMDWLTADPDFARRWFALMSACVGAGVSIRIVHNPDRGLGELVDAIESWMPLYMSGRIESFYCLRKNGGRFSHTLFLAPGLACVSACHAAGSDTTRYHYLTDPAELDFFAAQYGALLSDCRPLVHVAPASDDMRGFSAAPTGNLCLRLSEQAVVIRRTAAPTMDFTITHPLMRGAFDAYAGRLRPVDTGER